METYQELVSTVSEKLWRITVFFIRKEDTPNKIARKLRSLRTRQKIFIKATQTLAYKFSKALEAVIQMPKLVSYANNVC